MRTVALGEVASIERHGVDPKTLDPATNYLGLEHIERGGRIAGRDTVGGADLASTKFAFDQRHVLFGKLRPYLGKVASPWFSGVCSTDILPILPGAGLDRSYLTHFLRQPSIVALAGSRATGANLPRLSPGELAAFELPLPPLDEQRRIAGILDQADALRAKRRTALDRAQRDLPRVIYAELFGSPVSPERRFPIHTLGAHARSMTYGPRFYNEAYSAKGVRIARITDLDTNGSLDFESMPRMDVSAQVRDKSLLSAGDIIFARSGATVGKLAVITETDPPCIAGAYFIRIRLDESVTPHFVAATLRTPAVQAVIRSKSRQSAQQNFSGPGLRALPLPLPPLDLQREFAARVAAIDAQRTAAGLSLQKLDELFASLQARAFSGTL